MRNPSAAISTRHATVHDLSAIVEIHLRAFPGFFLTFLGSKFLYEFYAATLADPAGLLLIAEDSTRIWGFVAGTAQPAGFYRRLLRQRWWRFGWAALPAFLRQPRMLPRLLRALTMPSQVTEQAQRGTLMSIAVLPEAQGQGVGKVLVGSFLGAAITCKLDHVDLTTDAMDNEAANRFYQKLGFVQVRTLTTPEGRAMNEYVIQLPRVHVQ